jgi:isopenicillin N synthase-like dioxygenase
VIGYPPLPASFDTDTGISCGAHTDYGCLTFLLADPTPGALQVEAKDGSWIPADPVPGAFVVNIGDIIDTLTGHQYKSTYHRVIHRGENYRVSIPFFFEPMRDMVIKPFAEMIPPGVTVEPFTYFDHLKASQVPLHFKCCTALVLYHTVPRFPPPWITTCETASRCLKRVLFSRKLHLVASHLHCILAPALTARRA